MPLRIPATRTRYPASARTRAQLRALIGFDSHMHHVVGRPDRDAPARIAENKRLLLDLAPPGRAPYRAFARLFNRFGA